MAIASWATPNTADTPTWGTSLISLADGSYSLGSAIANDTGLYENAIIQVVMGASVTCGTGAPYLGFTLLYAPDGTNYPAPPGGTAGATGMPLSATIPAVASAAFTGGVTLPFLILPFKFKVLLFNKLGVAMSASGTTVTLTRFNEQII